MNTTTTYMKLMRMSTKILGSTQDSNSFLNYLSKNQIDINPLIKNENKLINQIMKYRESVVRDK